MASQFYLGGFDDEQDDRRRLCGLPLALGDLRRAVGEVEAEAVGQAKARLAELRAEHAALTRSWAKATEGMQEGLKQDIERLEAEIRA